MAIAHDEIAADRQRAAAQIVVEALALQMLMRVEAMEKTFEQKRHQDVAQRLWEEEDEPLIHDREEVLSIILEPDHEDVEDLRDLAVDLQAEPGRVYVSMPVVEAGATRLGGWLDVQDVRELQRGLAIVAEDAEAMQQEEDAEDGG